MDRLVHSELCNIVATTRDRLTNLLECPKEELNDPNRFHPKYSDLKTYYEQLARVGLDQFTFSFKKFREGLGIGDHYEASYLYSLRSVIEKGITGKMVVNCVKLFLRNVSLDTPIPSFLRNENRPFGEIFEQILDYLSEDQLKELLCRWTGIFGLRRSTFLNIMENNSKPTQYPIRDSALNRPNHFTGISSVEDLYAEIKKTLLMMGYRPDDLAPIPEFVMLNLPQSGPPFDRLNCSITITPNSGWEILASIHYILAYLPPKLSLFERWIHNFFFI